MFQSKHSLTRTELDKIQHYLLPIEAKLREEFGWDKRSIQVFVELLGNRLYGEISDQSLEKIGVILLEESQKVGSAIYLQMLSRYQGTAKVKLDLVLRHLGGTIDSFGMLQLKGPFELDTSLPPHSLFFKELSRLVQTAYLQKELTSKKIHQLRMYIDRQNLFYIKKNFKQLGMTDEQALALYVATPSKKGGLGKKKMLAERARLHNKFPRGEEQVSYFPNRKRLTPDFHSEFILDEQGNFVSQWNVLVETEEGNIISDPMYYYSIYQTKREVEWFEAQIMNGESFNYANKNNIVHRQLDSLPPRTLDYGLRQLIMKNWVSPDFLAYNWKTVDHSYASYAKKVRMIMLPWRRKS